jgi:hypothetical protein
MRMKVYAVRVVCKMNQIVHQVPKEWGKSRVHTSRMKFPANLYKECNACSHECEFAILSSVPRW